MIKSGANIIDIGGESTDQDQNYFLKRMERIKEV